MAKGSTAAFKESAALASVYVPEELRRVNERSISQGVITYENEPIPACIGPTTPNSDTIQFPFRQTIYPDLYWAVEERQRRTQSKKVANSETESLDNPPLQSKWNNLEDYCEYWEQILRQERKERLLLAERYSQYQVTIQVQSSQTHPRAVLKIIGIADASPPIERGDLVLIRPLKPLFKPLITPETAAFWHAMPPLRSHIEITCRVEDVQRSQGGRVIVTWLDNVQNKNLFDLYQSRGTPTFNVRFIPSVDLLRRIYTALDWLRGFKEDQHSHRLHGLLFTDQREGTSLPVGPEAPERLRLALPKEMTTIITTAAASVVKVFHRLNTDQRSFVNSVLLLTEQCQSNTLPPKTDFPLILTGPAGTGKTNALLTAIQFLWVYNRLGREPSNRILICAPSHTAADVITRRLGKFMNSENLFRLLSASRQVAATPTEVLPFCYQSPKTGMFELPGTLLDYEIIVCTTQDAHLLYQAGVTNQQLRTRREAFCGYVREVAAHCRMSCQLSSKDPHFTHFFMDEAAQATEPEALIPLSVVLDPGHAQVVLGLVGDPKQLSPAVYSSSQGLGISWMERLLDGRQMPDRNDVTDYLIDSFNYQRSGSTFLCKSYRCHEALLCLPSSLFYQDQLQQAKQTPMETTAYWLDGLRRIESLSTPVELPFRDDVPEEVQPQRTYAWPIHFCGVQGVDRAVTVTTGYLSNTWTNAAEADQVTQIVATLVQQHQVPTQAIGVMAPFRGQVVAIRKLLRNIGLDAINVGTVEDFQAVESSVIVLSLTRSTASFVSHDGREGLFGQAKRCNVALTRAENLLVVVGHPGVMAQDPIWTQFLWFCLRNGVYYGLMDDWLRQRWMGEFFRVQRQVTGSPPSVVKGENTTQETVIVGTLERAMRRAM